jgi:hypothetical protein
MARSLFQMGAWGSEPWFGMPVAPASVPVTRNEVDMDRGRVLKPLPVPKGWTLAYPYVVKIEGGGEYVVQADGSAVYYNLKAGRWEPPQTVDNRSLFATVYGAN